VPRAAEEIGRRKDKSFLVRERHSPQPRSTPQARLQVRAPLDWCRHHPIRRSRRCFTDSAFRRPGCTAFGVACRQRIFSSVEGDRDRRCREARANFPSASFASALHVAISFRSVLRPVNGRREPHQIHRAFSIDPVSTRGTVTVRTDDAAALLLLNELGS